MRVRKLKFPSLESVSAVLQVAGIGALVGAAWWWLPIVGLIALGLALLLIGQVIDP